MAHSYYQVYEHICFSVKDRLPLLTPEIRKELFAYLAGGVKNQNCFPVIVGGYREHVHLPIRKTAACATSDLVKEWKRISTYWLREKGVGYGKFSWQAGYGAFSISHWDVEKVKDYIENQETHHAHMGWEDEYRKLLVKHGVEFDERYILD
jgi:putative transposase